jgi:DHA1 family bicyclomycin/chloramphenicol resistance-like MFS transporter
MLRPDTFALTALLALLTGLGPLSTDMYLASMPDIGRTFAATPAQVQLTLSSYLVGFALGQILYGPVSDRHGRRRVLVAALSLYCAAAIVCALATSIEMLIAARFLQALGGSGAIVLARAVVRDLYSGARAGRELSLMSAVMALAPVIAPLIGGVVQAGFGWRFVFVVLLAIGLAAMAVVLRWLPETLASRAAEPVSLPAMLRSYRVVAADRGFLLNMAFAALSYGGLFAWISGSSFVLQDAYGLDPVRFGLAFAISALGFMSGAILAARLVPRIGIRPTIGLGACLLTAGGLLMAIMLLAGVTSPFAIAGSAAIYCAGMGLVLPQAFAGALHPFPERAGAASSLLGFVQQMTAALIGTIVGQMLGASAWPIAIALIVMGSLTLALFLTARLAKI